MKLDKWRVMAIHGLGEMSGQTRIVISIRATEVWLPSDKALELLRLTDAVRAIIEEGKAHDRSGTGARGSSEALANTGGNGSR